VNPSTAQARVLVDELVRCGVRQFVVCPGSRNAPLSMALARAADAGRLTLHVRIDERSAAFFALGLAKAGVGVAVVVTSGTAVANLHPAVLEAHHTRRPVLLLTADRPVELLRTGANQVIDARAVFGGAATLVDFPIAETRTGQNAMWRALVCRAVAAMASGPVQVNVPLREPLVPDGDDEWLEPLTGRPDDRPWTTLPAALPGAALPAAALPAAALPGAALPGAGLPAAAPESAGEPLPDLGPRPLLMLGDGDPALLTNAARTAAEAGWPVLAEPTATASALAGGAELITHGTLIANADALALRPTGLVVVGRPTLTRWVGRLMRTVGVAHVVDDNPQWTDAGHAATSVSRWLRPADLVAPQADPAWLASWRDADDAASGAVAKFLDEVPWPTGLRAAREIVAALPAEAVLFLGSSNPVRLVDLVAVPRADLRVYANRGVAGIDGSVSTANGLTLGLGVRGYALLGDLTFLHDANGLLLGPDEQRPDLTVIVLNDVGGGIFSLLEQGAPEHAASFERVFGTPHQVDIARLCAAHRVPHRRAETIDDLVTAIGEQGGLRVIEVPVPRDGIRELHAALAAAVRDAIR
jgi:2-succinyl-5-enolpyruvyl-6-hydroxy-3-cyclohexene-1-carboxylate synthase